MTASECNHFLDSNGASKDWAHYRCYIADMEQLAYARQSTLDQGSGRGDRIIEVNNGSGLSFTITPDRGMDIVDASFNGLPLSFRTPCGYVRGGKFEHDNFGWLRSWPGGLLTTCGLRHVGPPVSETGNTLDPTQGLHGRFSAQSAEDVSINRTWINGSYEITISGIVREAMMFGENLRLRRTIKTALSDNTIYLNDEVENLGHRPEPFQILYHCNFGYPAIIPSTYLEVPEHEILPRDEPSEAGLDNWRTMPQPQQAITEQCFLHRIPSDQDGWSNIKIINPDNKLQITVAYDASSLPNLLQWKLPEYGRYVMGLEPTNMDFCDKPINMIKAGGVVNNRLYLRCFCRSV